MASDRLYTPTHLHSHLLSHLHPAWATPIRGYIFPCILKQVTTGCWFCHFRTDDLGSTYSSVFGNNNQYCRVQMNSQVKQSDGAAVRIPVPGGTQNTFDKLFLGVFEHSDVLVNLVCYFKASYFNENFLNTKERIIYKKKDIKRANRNNI